MKKIYNFLEKEVYVPYDAIVELQQEGKISLSIGKTTARNITLNISKFDHSVSLSSVVNAQRLWTIVGFGSLAYSIYASFTGNWWWFIPGFIALGVTANANTDANAKNILEHAKLDPIFYNSISGFLAYDMDEDDAEHFKL